MSATLASAKASRDWDAIVIHPEDNVAVALRDCPAGTVRVRRGGAVESVAVLQPIALGHKFALSALPSGTVIRKYGESIGRAIAPIATGEHVHVHNLASQRARHAPV